MGTLELSIARPAQRREALELVLADLAAHEQRLLIDGLRPLAEAGIDVFAALVVAHEGRHLQGAAWLQPQVGRTGTLWPPHLREGASSSLTRDLAQFALDAGAALPVSLAQTLLDSSEDPFAADLEALGFTQLAELHYLMQTITPEAVVAAPDPRLQLKSPATANPALLEQIVLESYRGTLDCPQLDGMREFADTMAGYQAVGEHDPNLWWFAYWLGEPAGVLLVSPYPETNQWEVIYMGVIPPFRGRGIGSRLLAELHRRAATAGVDHIVLAVDAANGPARKIYDEAGFVEWARRVAMLKPMAAQGAD